MHTRIGYLATLLTLGVSGSAIYGQVSRTEARHMGLEVAWETQVQIPRAGSRLVSSHLWAEASNPRKYAVVELAERNIQVSAEALDRDGQPIGIEEAKKQAQAQASRALGRTDGFEVTEVSVPRLKLVLVTGDGLVQALDAETGKLIWATSCGRSSAPAHPAAVSTAGVSVIHGDRLFLLDWSTGKHAMSRQLRYSSANAVAACGDIGFVADFTGRIEAYGLGRDLSPWSYVILGNSVGEPITFSSGEYAAIASDQGYVYVFSGIDTPGVWLRYESPSPITGSLAAGPRGIYVGNASGLVTKFTLEDRGGRIGWELRAGNTVTAPALVVDDIVVVATEAGEVLAIDEATGTERWSSPTAGVAHPIGVAGERLLCLSNASELVALDAATGQPIARSRPMNLSHPMVNSVNDRIYLITKSGRVQCLRIAGATLPKMQSVVASEDEDEAEDTNQRSTSEPVDNTFLGGAAANSGFGGADFGETTNADEDPFGGAGDPFGAMDAGADPFGGGNDSDPFGGSNDSENPFGSDPFGNGN